MIDEFFVNIDGREEEEENTNTYTWALATYVCRAGKWHNVVHISVTGKLMVCKSSVLSSFIMLAIHFPYASHTFAPASSADWFNKGCAMIYYVYVVTPAKDP